MRVFFKYSFLMLSILLVISTLTFVTGTIAVKPEMKNITTGLFFGMTIACAGASVMMKGEEWEKSGLNALTTGVLIFSISFFSVFVH
jgi:hypothetical protein